MSHQRKCLKLQPHYSLKYQRDTNIKNVRRFCQYYSFSINKSRIIMILKLLQHLYDHYWGAANFKIRRVPDISSLSRDKRWRSDVFIVYQRYFKAPPESFFCHFLHRSSSTWQVRGGWKEEVTRLISGHMKHKGCFDVCVCAIICILRCFLLYIVDQDVMSCLRRNKTGT